MRLNASEQYLVTYVSRAAAALASAAASVAEGDGTCWPSVAAKLAEAQEMVDAARGVAERSMGRRSGGGAQ